MSRPKGRPLPEEHRLKIMEAMQGVPKTPDHRQRMSESAKKAWNDRRQTAGRPCRVQGSSLNVLASRKLGDAPKGAEDRRSVRLENEAPLRAYSSPPVVDLKGVA